MKTRIQVRIDPDFQGPTLTEVAPLIVEGSTFEVSWGCTHADQQALMNCSGANLTLVVQDMEAQEKTQAVLGLTYSFPDDLKERVSVLISKRSKALEWRKFVGVYGIRAARGILTNLIREGTLKGKRVPAAKVIASSWTNSIHPSDLDILLDLEGINA